MTPKLLDVQDIASASFALAMIALLATGVLMLAGTGWVARRWKLVVALGGVTALVGAAHLGIANDVWLATGKSSMIHRYVGWFITIPLQVVTLYFFVRVYARIPVGVFWRTFVAAVLLVTSRFMGEANLMLPMLGFLLSLAFWLYILGEAYFGAMSQGDLRHGSETARRGFFWLRLIMTLGWAILPLTYFVTTFTGPVQMRYVMTTYNLSDFINVAAFALTLLATAMGETDRANS